MTSVPSLQGSHLSPETTSVEFDLLSHHVTVGWDRFNKDDFSEMTLKSKQPPKIHVSEINSVNLEDFSHISICVFTYDQKLSSLKIVCSLICSFS